MQRDTVGSEYIEEWKLTIRLAQTPQEIDDLRSELKRDGSKMTITDYHSLQLALTRRALDIEDIIEQHLNMERPEMRTEVTAVFTIEAEYADPFILWSRSSDHGKAYFDSVNELMVTLEGQKTRTIPEQQLYAMAKMASDQHIDRMIIEWDL